MPIKRRPSDTAKIQMTPMIDMTFLLLVFFLVTTKITQEKKKMEIELPKTVVAKSPDDVSGREIINIDGEGNYYAGERPISTKDLKAYLKQRLIDYPPLKVMVRADLMTPSKKIKEVMQLCSDSGAIEVIFSSLTQK